MSLDGAPNGLRKYSLTLSTSALVEIGSVEPRLVAGGEFQVVDGGSGAPTVTVRAADLSRSVGSFDGTETLVTVAFDGAVSRDDLDLAVATLVDDDGEPMDPDRVTLAVLE